jgi:hypothetical protein
MRHISPHPGLESSGKENLSTSRPPGLLNLATDRTQSDIEHCRLHNAQVIKDLSAFVPISDYASHFGGTGRIYSHRSATIGSTFIARRAGM